MMFSAVRADAKDPERITIGYFQEWPAPIMVSRDSQALDKELGVAVSWRAFETGYDMNRALGSGEIEIAYAQELIPFLAGVGGGLDVVMTGVAVSYSSFEQCVVSENSGFNKLFPQQLEGKKIAVVKGSSSHFKLLKIIEYLGIDKDKIELVFVRHGRAASRMMHYDKVIAGCAFGASVVSMKEGGHYLLTAREQEAIGLKMFDLVAMAGWFLREHRQLAQKFMNMIAQSNALFKTNPNAMLAEIAEGSGLKIRNARSLLNLFEFPTTDQQRSKEWLGPGGDAWTYAKQLADFLVSQGKLENSLDDYSLYIDTGLLQ